LNISLRFPIGNSIFKEWILKKKISILYFHPLDAIDVKSLMLCERSKFRLFKNYLIRPDRWINTGNSFIRRFENFIKEALSRSAEFVTVKQLIK